MCRQFVKCFFSTKCGGVTTALVCIGAIVGFAWVRFSFLKAIHSSHLFTIFSREFIHISSLHYQESLFTAHISSLYFQENFSLTLFVTLERQGIGVALQEKDDECKTDLWIHVTSLGGLGTLFIHFS